MRREVNVNRTEIERDDEGLGVCYEHPTSRTRFADLQTFKKHPCFADVGPIRLARVVEPRIALIRDPITPTPPKRLKLSCSLTSAAHAVNLRNARAST
jgi:hypothetical protein